MVAIEYPRRGVWAVGFLTGGGFTALDAEVKANLVTVFIPSSPTPMTGYVVFIPADEVVALSITVEEAFRMIISGGVIKPGQKIPRVGEEIMTQIPAAEQPDRTES